LHLATVDAAGLVDFSHGHLYTPATGDAVLGADGQAHHRAHLDGRLGCQGQGGSE
jgi:hypothetical protein